MSGITIPHIAISVQPAYNGFMPLLTVSGLRKHFNLEAGFFARFGHFVYAVNGVSFALDRNEAYGLVGESGCGKTTTARLLVRMYEADGGRIMYHQEEGGVDVAALRKGELRQYRQKVRYVFQDPARSLNPRMSVGDILLSGLRWSGDSRESERRMRERAALALEEVGLSASDLEKRPAEFSGGQRQRISIARGLLPQPQLLICDEVVSALDVSIQAQILNLLLDIREKRISQNQTMSFLFIAHDLKVACYFCDRIGVMYAGELVEEAPAASLWREGQHPYTQILFASATGADNSPPRPSATPAPLAATCCAFAARCPQAASRCLTEPPPLRQVAPGHSVRCHLGN